MRFITEFETDDSNYVKGIKKIHGEENIGHEIARSFGWDEKGVTKLDPDVRVSSASIHSSSASTSTCALLFSAVAPAM